MLSNTQECPLIPDYRPPHTRKIGIFYGSLRNFGSDQQEYPHPELELIREDLETLDLTSQEYPPPPPELELLMEYLET